MGVNGVLRSGGREWEGKSLSELETGPLLPAPTFTSIFRGLGAEPCGSLSWFPRCWHCPHPGREIFTTDGVTFNAHRRRIVASRTGMQ